MTPVEPPPLRLARPDDADRITELMHASIRDLFPRYYDDPQTASAAVHVGHLDLQLIDDGTFYVAEAEGEIVACGGWSRRNKLYSGSGESDDDSRLLDPATEPARVRAMFVRSDWTRRGLGRAILLACERDARAEGFTRLALVATLPGEPLYRAFGFREIERLTVTTPDGVNMAGVAMERPVRPDRTAGLQVAAAHAARYLEGLDLRPVRAASSAADVRDALGGPMPAQGTDPREVLDHLVAGYEPGVVASSGPRHFGFVIGGSLPAAIAADWLVSAWDQCAAFHSLSPAAAALEQVTSEWALDVLGLPASASVGFVTGAQGANTTCLAAARHAVLRRAGWDVERDGLTGAPRVHVVCGEHAHATIYTALRLLGLGADTAVRVEADDQARMLPSALRDTLGRLDGPIIVCAQAGNVATGAFEDFHALADACAEAGAWLHVDGAFGLWAAASPALRHLVDGVDRADSWALDAHKWLNVPYDGALAIVADAAAHHAAMSLAGPYLVADPGQRDNTNYVPESSRRARAVPVYAALRSLGRDGLAALVERNCAQARRMAERLAEVPGVEILNDVVLNQVLVRLPGDDDTVRATIADIQRDGTCWLGGTRWNDREVLRLAFSNWSTTDDDIDASADAIATAVRARAPTPATH